MSNSIIAQYHLRPAVAEDFDFFRQVHHQTMRAYVEPIFGWDDLWQLTYLQTRYNPSEMQVIVIDGKDAGVLVFEQQPDFFLLKLLLIDPSVQGHGVGTLILHDLIEQARGKKLPLLVSVLKSNLPAKRFYQRHGFVKSNEDEHRSWLRWEPTSQIADFLVVLASSRSHGDTRHTVDQAFRKVSYQLVDLHKKTVSYFDYDHHNQADDFLTIAEQMTAAKRILFVTPIYWSSISGVMKVFIDRFSDLTSIRQDLGKALAGKQVSVLVVGSPDAMPVGIEAPFVEICQHFGMSYQGVHYAYIGVDKARVTSSEQATAEFAKSFV
jgi:multimeric flavodoxin WrbA/GNAT superfamily N-acetyltransferase